jgi:predicted HTH domain antitoxin
MTQLVLDIDPGAFSVLRLGPKEMSQELKTAAVVQWYAEERISQSKACEILGMSRVHFLDELLRRKVSAIQVKTEELAGEIAGER